MITQLRRFAFPMIAAALPLAVWTGSGSSPAVAQERYEFLAPPSTTKNRIYRVDTRTGAMGVCWFNGTHTECLNGSGLAGPQTPGRYALMRSELPTEHGVFRVELNTGSVSNCWIRQAALVCTLSVR